MASFAHHARFRWDHRWMTARLSDYLDGDLGSRARTRARRHIDECEECRRALAGLRAVVGVLHRLPAPTGGRAARETAAAVRSRLSEPAPD